MRALAWTGLEEWLAEHAQVDVDDDGIMATGVQLGVEPEPYLLEYRLDVPGEWITQKGIDLQRPVTEARMSQRVARTRAR